jgi:hypothetical protein
MPNAAAAAGGGGGDAAVETTRFQRPCQRNSCNGFINSRTGECPSCESYTCIRCNIHVGVKTEMQAHECAPDDIAQWQEIQKSSKPCPGCGTAISKTSGCDQMWCPECHTAFSWKTGQIEHGAIHNPGYYDWLFNGGGAATAGVRVGGDGGCRVPGELRWQVIQALRNRASHPLDDEIRKEHRLTVHRQNIVLPRLRQNIGNADRKNGHMVRARLDFLQNRSQEKEIRTRIQRFEKANQKTIEFNRIYETFVTITLEAFDRFVLNEQMTKQELYTTITTIKSIAKDGIAELNKCYKSKITLEGLDN